MAEILYKPERDRCPRLTLRYHNVRFYHAILCFEVIGTQPTTLTCRKLCGKYFHNVVRHAPIQLCIISGESSNTEDEARYFNSIKGITRETSLHHLSHIIENILIRLQAKKMFRESYSTHAEKIKRPLYSSLQRAFLIFLTPFSHCLSWKSTMAGSFEENK